MGQELQKIDEMIVSAKPLMISTIKQYQWELIPDTQLLAAKAALTKSDYIMKIAVGDPGAVHDALIKGAILGVDLTESKRQAYLLPRKNAAGKTVIQLQVGYKGIEAIHQKMGVIDRLVIRVVHENDHFEWSGDDAEKPNHQAEWFSIERGKIIGVYSITYFPSGQIHVMTAPISEIYEKHRALSDSWKQYQKKKAAGENPFPPSWLTHEKAMIEKTMAYIASKQWPANIRNTESASKILETLHEVDTADYREAFARYSDKEKEIFDLLVREEDALGLHLMYRRFKDGENLEAWNGLYNSFPRGEKVKNKKLINSLCDMGLQMENNITQALADEDEFLLLENLHGAANVTRSMLWETLPEKDQEFLKAAVNGEKA